MSAEESALCEAAYRSRTAANLASRSAVETAVEAAVREASEFVEENATEYRKLKVLLVKAEMVRRVHCNKLPVARLNQRSLKDRKVKPSRRADIRASMLSDLRRNS